jgi:hypothetical protein
MSCLTPLYSPDGSRAVVFARTRARAGALASVQTIPRLPRSQTGGQAAAWATKAHSQPRDEASAARLGRAHKRVRLAATRGVGLGEREGSSDRSGTLSRLHARPIVALIAADATSAPTMLATLNIVSPTRFSAARAFGPFPFAAASSASLSSRGSFRGQPERFGWRATHLPDARAGFAMSAAPRGGSCLQTVPFGGVISLTR